MLSGASQAQEADPVRKEAVLTALLGDSMVQVAGYKASTLAASGYGVYVGELADQSIVLIPAVLVANADTLTVRSSTSAAELMARLGPSNDTGDMRLLSVRGLNATAATFSAVTPQTGDLVYALGRDDGSTSLGLNEGSVLNVVASADAPGATFRHNAGFDRGALATLANGCAQIAGLSIATIDGQVQALDSQTVQAFLQQQEIVTNVAAEGCEVTLEDLRRRAQLAAQTVAAANLAASTAQEQARRLEEQVALGQGGAEVAAEARQARLRADNEAIAARQAQADLVKSRAALDASTADLLTRTKAMVDLLEQDHGATKAELQQALAGQAPQSGGVAPDNQSFSLTMTVLAAAVLAIAVLGGLVWRKQRQLPARVLVAEPAGADGSSPATQLAHRALTEYALDGKDVNGVRFLIKMSADLLHSQAGAVVGRNPKEAQYIINHGDVSRQHLRVKIVNDRFFVEDLNSTNGSSVNGRAIHDKGMVAVSHGDQIVLGSVLLTLRLISL